ncbi:MAG: hypothetical protein HGA65_15380, partial [Oscillochloris sp.]|nr:hypothetical protein [Oscillochloris sp.]
MQALLPDLDPAIDTLMDDIDAARAESYPLLMSMRLLGREPSGDPTAIADAL